MSRINWPQGASENAACLGPSRKNEMSVVLPFPKNPVSKRAAVQVFESAEIVIFPGVRVERRSFDLAQVMTASRKRHASQAAIDEDQLDLT
jgi:hypothetical protein